MKNTASVMVYEASAWDVIILFTIAYDVTETTDKLGHFKKLYKGIKIVANRRKQRFYFHPIGDF